MNAEKRLSIILPSFRDERILEAIASVRSFDDRGLVRLVIIDGGSPPPLVERIASVLTADDVLVSEPDGGIFDALNKGLARVATPYVGWLGSDDLFSGAVLASEVVARLEECDLFLASLAFVKGDRVRRVTHSWPASAGLSLIGLHNPHYATFGRTSLLAAERFEPADLAADIDYFLRIFERKPRVARTAAIGTLQGEGGFSNASFRKMFAVNQFVFRSYRRRTNSLAAAAGVGIKLGYKALGRLYFSLFPVEWPAQFPVAREAQRLARGLDRAPRPARDPKHNG